MQGKQERRISLLPQIVVSVLIALVAGGSAPWWWKELTGTAARPPSAPAAPAAPPPAPAPTVSAPTVADAPPDSPEATVAAYWSLVLRGQLDRSWALLSPSFQQVAHPAGFADYQRAHGAGYCDVHVSVYQSKIDGDRAVVLGELALQQRPTCRNRASLKEFVLVREGAGRPWLLDVVRSR